EYRNHTDMLALLVESGCGDHFKVYVRTFDRIDKGQVSAERLRGSHSGARKIGREKKIVHLERAALALAGILRTAEEFLGALVLKENLIVQIREYYGVGDRFHNRFDPLPLRSSF